MAELKVVGFWDKPSPESQGMLALILTDGESHFLSGFAGSIGPRKLWEGDFEGLIRNESVLPVDAVPLPENCINPVAHWLGNFFLEKSVSWSGPELPDVRNWHVHERGRFEICEPGVVYRRLEGWLKAAAKLALKYPEKGRELAALMRWTSPNLFITGAIQWHIQRTEEGKRTELAWYARLYDGQIDEAGIVLAFQKIIDDLKKEMEA